jgi:uroporphyrin-3 C-methyltransferase
VPLWARLRDDAWEQFRQLVRIRDIENADPVLLNPTQAFFLRENLKLRLLNARFGLLQRDEQNFREDVKLAQAWIARYFDTRAKPVQNAQAMLRSFAGTALAIELPSLSSSIDAVRNYKLAREKPLR